MTVDVVKQLAEAIKILGGPAAFDPEASEDDLEEIEMALMDDGGVYGETFADSFTITVEVPTHQLMDTASCLKDLGLI